MPGHSFFDRLFELLVNASVVVTFLVALAWLLFRARTGVSAAFRSMVWTTTLAATIGLPILFAIVPADLRLLPIHASAASSVTAMSPVSAANTDPLSPPAEHSVPRREAVTATMPVAPANLMPVALRCAVIVWLVGVVFVLGRFALGNLFLYARLRAPKNVHSSDWNTSAEEAAQQLNVDRLVGLRPDEKISAPAVWGFFKATIFLPLVSDWSADRKRTILLHELAHIKRRDHQALWLKQLVAAIYWFHPAVLLAVAESNLACEQACDDLVLGAGASPCEYARLLLEISETLPVDENTAAFVGFLGARSLERRVVSILNAAASRRTPTAFVRVTTTATMLPLLVLFAAARPFAPASEAKATAESSSANATDSTILAQSIAAPAPRSPSAIATSSDVAPVVSRQPQSAAAPTVPSATVIPDAPPPAPPAEVSSAATAVTTSSSSAQPIAPASAPAVNSEAPSAPVAPASSATPNSSPLAATLPTPPAPAEHAASTVVLPNGTPLWLLFAHDVNSDNVAPGSLVSFVVPGDIRIGNTVVVRAGASAVGTITHIKKAKIAGRSGAIDIRIEYLQVGNSKIRLSTDKVGGADLHYSAPYGMKWPLGLFRKGNEMNIPSGTGFTAYVSEDVTLPVVN